MTKIYRRAVAGNLESIGPREFEAIAVTSELQDDGYALSMEGANLSRFQSGRGPLLFNHDPASIIGTVTSIRATSSTVPFRARFASDGVSKLASEICGLLKDGIVNNVSAGFDVEEVEPINPGRPRDGMRAIKWTLYEVSLVAVNLDPNAVVTARSHRAHSAEAIAARGDLGQFASALARAFAPRASRRLPGRQPAHVENPLLSDDPLAVMAWENYGERLTPARVEAIKAQARQCGRSAEYHFSWTRMVGSIVSDVDDFDQRQREKRRLEGGGS